MKIQPFYSIADIAELMGYSKNGARKFINNLNIPINKVGNKHIIYLSDLRNNTPEFYYSLLEANNLQSQLDDADLPIDDLCNKNQFNNNF